MTDYTLEETIFSMFTTRAFATGIPTVLSGSPVVSAYENDSATQITAGITLGVSHDSVVGMNLLTVVATAANGYESGKDYNLVVTTGTVGGVSVVGEVVGVFSIGRAAAFGIVNDGVFGNSALNDSIGNISGSGTGTGAVNASGATITTGVQTLTFVATQEEDGVLHQVAPSGGNTDFEYTVTLAANQSVTNVTWRGFVQSNNDTVQVQFFNFNTSTFVTEKILTGSNATTLIDDTFNAVSDYTGTGANLGKVRLRFLSTTTTNIATDRLRFVFSSNFQSVGYADGAIWVDTINGVAGTVPFINGVADNPVLTWADALTLSASVGLKRFRINNGSTIQLTASSNNFTLIGGAWILDLNGQSISAALFEGATVSGTGTGATRPEFSRCELGTCTLVPFVALNSGLNGTITFSGAGDYEITSCHSSIAGALTPIIDTGATVANVNLTMPAYSQGIEIRNLNTLGTDLFSISGKGQIIYAASSSGIVEQRGNWKTTNTGGVTITTDDVAQNVSDILTDTGTTLPATLTTIEGKIDVVDTNVDSILVDTGTTLPAQITALNDISPAEVNAEVLDVMATDTFAEPSGVPAATASLKDKIGYLAAKARNKKTQTATTQTLRNDADSGNISTATVSDDGTTFVKGEDT